MENKLFKIKRLTGFEAKDIESKFKYLTSDEISLDKFYNVMIEVAKKAKIFNSDLFRDKVMETFISDISVKFKSVTSDLFKVEFYFNSNFYTLICKKENEYIDCFLNSSHDASVVLKFHKLICDCLKDDKEYRKYVDDYYYDIQSLIESNIRKSNASFVFNPFCISDCKSARFFEKAFDSYDTCGLIPYHSKFNQMNPVLLLYTDFRIYDDTFDNNEESIIEFIERNIHVILNRCEDLVEVDLYRAFFESMVWFNLIYKDDKMKRKDETIKFRTPNNYDQLNEFDIFKEYKDMFYRMIDNLYK